MILMSTAPERLSSIRSVGEPGRRSPRSSARSSSALAPSTCGLAIWLEKLACSAGITVASRCSRRNAHPSGPALLSIRRQVYSVRSSRKLPESVIVIAVVCAPNAASSRSSLLAQRRYSGALPTPARRAPASKLKPDQPASAYTASAAATTRGSRLGSRRRPGRLARPVRAEAPTLHLRDRRLPWRKVPSSYGARPPAYGAPPPTYCRRLPSVIRLGLPCNVGRKGWIHGPDGAPGPGDCGRVPAPSATRPHRHPRRPHGDDGHAGGGQRGRPAEPGGDPHRPHGPWPQRCAGRAGPPLPADRPVGHRSVSVLDPRRRPRARANRAG